MLLAGLTGALLLSGCSRSQPPAPAPPEPAESKPELSLANFVGEDLRTLNKERKDELHSLLARTLPQEELADHPFNAQPWAVWRSTAAPEQNGFILFRGQHLFVIPGNSSATVHFFDRSGKLLNTVAFATGWRINIESATMRTDEALRGQLIEVRSGPAINGGDVCRQMYGVTGNRLALLWLEDSTGTLVPNTYFATNLTIGPLPPNRTAAEWEQALASTQPMLVLEALTWLGGYHLRDVNEGLGGAASEDLETAKLVAEFRQRPSVRKRIAELVQSKEQRTQRAAKLAIASFEPRR
ncbi:MAG: hypothetical protein C0467_24255 [Planctomycetaceae bacterium]|nr:hypothetical protein [Planctomycetaceae bacterium]